MGWASPLMNRLIILDKAIHITMAAMKATKYPEILLISTLPMAEALAEKQLSSKKVVETGILMRVNISKKIGAATCRKVNETGA
jgi:hypothetical protein